MIPKGGCLVQTSSAICFADAQLTNARALALVGNSEAGAYELLFSFSTPRDKDQFLNLVRSNEDMGSDYVENDFMSPTTEEIRNARPLVVVLPEDIVRRATLIASVLCAGTERGSFSGSRRLLRASRGDSLCRDRAPTRCNQLKSNGVGGHRLIL